MTCPDWTRLAAHRLAAAGSAAAEEPEGWEAALGHLDGCPDCRRRALAADPVLAFRSLPAWELEPGAVEDVRAGVAALRRAHRIERRGHRLEAGREAAAATAAGPQRWWGRAAAAAVLAAALLAVGPAAERPPGSDAGGAFAVRAVPVAFLEDSTLPAVDDIAHPTASVYHFAGEDLELVMVVDAGFDV